MNDKKKYEKNEPTDEIDFMPKSVTNKRFGVVEAIRSTYLLVNENGNGVRIPFIKALHANVKVGEKVELP